MATVAEIAKQLNLQVLTQNAPLNYSITGGYASDLLSCVMAKAQAGNVWVTLQAHPNVVAVASLLNLACVIVTEDTNVESPTLEKAEEVGVPILRTPLTTFSIIERLHQCGIHGIDSEVTR